MILLSTVITHSGEHLLLTAHNGDDSGNCFFAARFANYSNGDRAAGRKLAINLQLYPSCHTTLQSDDVDVLLARPLL